MKNILCIVLALAGAGAVFANNTTIEIGSRREIFVDRHLVDSMDNVAHVLGVPTHAGTVLRFDAPWEGRYSGYVTVFKDDKHYRMYYRGLPEARRDGSDSETTCYAESDDGIHWNKPELGLFSVNGSDRNNVVLAGHAPYSHNFAPFYNTRPDAPDAERYLAVAGTKSTGLAAFASEDGLRWRMLEEGIIRDGAFDSQNVAFWSESEQSYVCYFRTWSGGGYDGYRWVSRSTSPDFIHWSEPEVMDAGNAPPEHIYTNQTLAYYRAPHIYISLAARFMPGRRIVSSEVAAQLGVEPGYFNDCSDNVLMTSRGGAHYERCFMEAFVRPGIGLEHWTSRTNYPAWGLAPTGEHEMSFYIQHSYGQPTARLDRYTLRVDGFASIRAGYDGGTFTTRPLLFKGDALYVNFSTSAAGGIRVALLDATGAPIPGFTGDDADELIGNMTDRIVRWNDNADVGALAGMPIRLRFIMKDADLYAVQFR